MSWGSPDTLIFTSENYNSGLSVFVVGLWDEEYDGDIEYTIYFHFNKVWAATNLSSTLTEFAYGKYPETFVHLVNLDGYDIEMGETISMTTTTTVTGVPIESFDDGAQKAFVSSMVGSMNISYVTAHANAA